MELQKQQEEKLTTIVNAVFRTNILGRGRLRKKVYARMVFCDVLRELNFGSSTISRYLKCSHSTVHHYWKSLNDVMKYDMDLKGKYLETRSIFYDGYDPIHGATKIKDLKKQIISLENKINSLNLENSLLEKKVLELQKEDNKYRSLIQIIRQRTRPNTEKEIEKKLNRFYNGVYL
jgi:hypothetical protein